MKRFRQIFITFVIFLLFFSAVAHGDIWTTKRLTWNGFSSNPAVAVDGSNIYVVWARVGIYFKRSNDGGVTWTPNKRLTNNAGNSAYPAIAVDGPNIYVVWHSVGIYFKKSGDGGTTWTTKRLTDNEGSVFPAIAVDGPNIYVVWSDDTPGNPGNWEVYFKKGILY